MLTAGFRWAPEILPMNRMIENTIRAGATTAAVRLIVSGNAWPIIPPPAATRTRKNVPRASEKTRRHSWSGFWKSAIGPTMLRSNSSVIRSETPVDCDMSHVPPS
jgi:hypothetical protein